MNLRFQEDCQNIDFESVRSLLKNVGMGYYEAAIHQRAFNNSVAVVFVFDNERLIGCGRAIGDGAYNAAIYDIAVSDDYQGHGLGKAIMQRIMSHLASCNVVLYAAPGKEMFYRKLGFRKMLTGMARFTNEERMIQRGYVEE